MTEATTGEAGGWSRALRRSGRAAAGKLLIFLIVGLCWQGLVLLESWHDTYAPSAAWADRVERIKELEPPARKPYLWRRVVSAAARTMPPTRRFATPDLFYAELFAVVVDPKSKLQLDDQDLKEVTAYREQRDVRRELLLDYTAALRVRDNSFRADLLKGGDRRNEAALTAAEMMRIEARLQQIRASQDDPVKSAEKGMREAFDATVSSARPVDKRRPRLHDLALAIGDEQNKAHVVYVITWYLLQTAIVVLVCLAVVPWLLAFSKDSSSTQSFKDRLRGLLGSPFGKKAAEGAGKVIATAAVGALTLGGVVAATSLEAPGATPFGLHQAVELPPGGPGPAPPGEPGGDRDAPDAPKGGDTLRIELDTWLAALGDRLLVENWNLRNDFQILQQGISNYAGTAVRIEPIDPSLKMEIQELAGQVNQLSARQVEVGDRLASVEGVLGGRFTALDTAVAGSRKETRVLRKEVRTAAAEVSPAAADVLRVTAKENNALNRANPWSRYQVTPTVVDTVRRAIPKPDEAPGDGVLRGLKRIPARPLKIWQLRSLLEQTVPQDPATESLLEELMPLILRLSRVPR